jgi:hypothetical protein
MKLNKRRGFKHSGRGHRKHKSGSRGGTGRAGHRTHKALKLEKKCRKSRYINYDYIINNWSKFENKGWVMLKDNEQIIFSSKFKGKIINIPTKCVTILGSNKAGIKSTEVNELDANKNL